MSESKNLSQRILGVRGDVEYIQKEDKKVNNQYTFVSHDAVSKALHNLLCKHGIVLIPRCVKLERDGNLTIAYMEIDFINADNPEDKTTVPMPGYGIDPQDKGIGKAVSYATKYAMLKTFVLETGDDPERDNINHEGADVAAIRERVRVAVEAGDWITLCEIDRPGDEAWLTAWGGMGSKERSAIKKLQTVRDDYRDRMNGMANSGDLDGFAELSNELSNEEARYLYKVLLPEAKAILTDLRKKAA